MQQFSHLPDQQILEGDTNPSGIASGRTSELLWQSFVNKGEAQSSFFLYGVDSGEQVDTGTASFATSTLTFTFTVTVLEVAENQLHAGEAK